MGFREDCEKIVDFVAALDSVGDENLKRKPRKDGNPDGVHLWKTVNDARTHARVKRHSGPTTRAFREAQEHAAQEHLQAYEMDARAIASNLEGFDSSGSRGIRRDPKAPLPRIVPGMGRVLAQRDEYRAREAAARKDLERRLEQAAKRKVVEERRAFWEAFQDAWA